MDTEELNARLNRTFMELKSAEELGQFLQRRVLIEPLWN